jgi:flavin reductase (DIM6/NTAB) family NADH-FMN oxidoreductase RutF
MNTRISSLGQGNRSPILRGVSIDPKQFRSVMATFATGVAVIATEWSGELFGATINSLTSVSLEPCMLLVCTSEGSATGAAIRNRGFFSVNILGQHQSELSARFTGNPQNRFEDLAVAFSADGLPLLQGAAAQLCCRVAAVPQGRRPRYHPGRGVLGRRDYLSSACFSQRGVWEFSACLAARGRMRATRTAVTRFLHSYLNSNCTYRTHVGRPAPASTNEISFSGARNAVLSTTHPRRAGVQHSILAID